jgi:hypothetical protein
MTSGTRRGWVVSVTPQPLFTPGKDPVPIVQEAGWAPGLVWTGAENLAPTRIWSPDRPAHSQSLYRLSYPTRIQNVYWVIFNHCNNYKLFSIKCDVVQWRHELGHERTIISFLRGATMWSDSKTPSKHLPWESVIRWRFELETSHTQSHNKY